MKDEVKTEVQMFVDALVLHGKIEPQELAELLREEAASLVEDPFAI